MTTLRKALENLNSPTFPLEAACEGGRCFWWDASKQREPTEAELAELGLSTSVPELNSEGHGSYSWTCWGTDGEVYSENDDGVWDLN